MNTKKKRSSKECLVNFSRKWHLTRDSVNRSHSNSTELSQNKRKILVTRLDNSSSFAKLVMANYLSENIIRINHEFRTVDCSDDVISEELTRDVFDLCFEFFNKHGNRLRLSNIIIRNNKYLELVKLEIGHFYITTGAFNDKVWNKKMDIPFFLRLRKELDCDLLRNIYDRTTFFNNLVIFSDALESLKSTNIISEMHTELYEEIEDYAFDLMRYHSDDKKFYTYSMEMYYELTIDPLMVMLCNIIKLMTIGLGISQKESLKFANILYSRYQPNISELSLKNKVYSFSQENQQIIEELFHSRYKALSKEKHKNEYAFPNLNKYFRKK